MDNLDKLIDDLSDVLRRKYIQQAYLISSNLSAKVTSSEILQNWSCFLDKNNIELIPIGCTAESEITLLNLINREQHRIKNKIIFMTEYHSANGNSIGRFYVLTTRENAQKLVVLGSFEN